MKQFVIACFVLVLIFSCGSKKEIEEPNQVDRSTQNRMDKDRSDRKGPPSAAEIFKMDINADGLLAKSEVHGRLLEDFDRFDSNRDGFISKEEFENAPRPKRRGGGSRNN